MLSFQRLLIVYVVAIPLALMLGYFAATPDVASIAVVGLVFFVLALPLLMRWSHWLVIFFWNSAFIAGFLPGQIHLWVVLAVLTFGLGVINHVMGHGKFLRAPELTKPILILLAVVLLTARTQGGAGLRALGSQSFGGRRYVDVLAAIIGYFALTSQPISVSKSARTAQWFFLSETSFGFCNVIYMLGPTFYFLYYFISPDYAYRPGCGRCRVRYGQTPRRAGSVRDGAALLCSGALGRAGSFAMGQTVEAVAAGGSAGGVHVQRLPFGVRLFVRSALCAIHGGGPLADAFAAGLSGRGRFVGDIGT